MVNSDVDCGILDFLEHLNGIEGYVPEHGYKFVM